MSSPSAFGQQSYMPTSHEGRKRGSPFEESGTRDGDQKRLRAGTGYDQDLSQFFLSSGTVADGYMNYSSTGTSSPVHEAPTPYEWYEGSPIGVKHAFESSDSTSLRQGLAGDGIDNTAIAESKSSFGIIPSVQIMSAEQDKDAATMGDTTLSMLSQDISVIAPLDTCFGAVITPVQSLLTSIPGGKKASVNFDSYGDVLRLSLADSGRYVGILDAAGLRTLLQNPSFLLKGTLTIAKKDQKNDKKAKGDSTSHQISNCSVRILIYGPRSEKQNVSKAMSDAELYLQHPTRAELGSMEYDNPHFLLRPGVEMPSLEQLSITSGSETSEVTDILDESTISLVMRVFDSENVLVDTTTDQVSDRVQAKLKDYQKVALAMMQERECGSIENTKFPSLWRRVADFNGKQRYRNTVTEVVKNDLLPFYGGVLADEMGLGKTLVVLSIICWSLDSQVSDNPTEAKKSPRATLVVTPKSTINSWQDQIKRHIKPNGIRYAVFHGNSRACFPKSRPCDVILTTYETLRSDWFTKKLLHGQQWKRIILDEAHHIRSPSSQIFKAVCELRSKHRWCLSGTPICNSLTDYGSLLTFIGVAPFSDRKSFKAWILDPIKERRPDSFKRLEALVRATCLRRKKAQHISELNLPSKTERIQLIDLSPSDRKVYNFFKVKTSELAVDISLRRATSRKAGSEVSPNIVTMINVLRRICDHGEQLLPSFALEIWKGENNDRSIPAQLQTLAIFCDVCKGRMYSQPENGLGCEHIICVTCVMSIELGSSGNGIQCPKCMEDALSKVDNLALEHHGAELQPSAKIMALIQNLKSEQDMGSVGPNLNKPAKSLVFSVWTTMLNLVHHHLQVHGFHIARIDGSCSLQQRDQAIKTFNEDPSCTIMLASIGSAGEGIDFTAANNVHLLEPHWNPMQESQAIDRVHRIGQQSRVHVVRYLTNNTIEMYVQWIQEEKIRLISQTLDSTHVSQAEIDERRLEKLQQYIGSLGTAT